MRKQIKKNGFTIIETLVAITVLMLAVAGPLVVASKGLTAALYSKDQMIATFLAQESLEVIKNERDNSPNLLEENWLAQFSECIGEDARCDASAIETLRTGGSPNGWSLTFSPHIGYGVSSNGQPTIFKRYFYIDNVTTQAPEHARAVVVVSWVEGTIPYEIRLVSELVNIRR